MRLPAAVPPELLLLSQQARFHYPESNVEIDIVKTESGVDKSTASKLVKIAHKVRNLHELGLSESISTRLLVDAGKLIASGLPPRLSVEVGMIQPLSDDEDTLTALKDLCDLMI